MSRVSSKLNKAALLGELQARATRPKEKIFSIENYCFAEQRAFILDTAKFKTAVCSRRAGKCLVVGTMVLTPTGSRPIEQIKTGDTVYGLNIDGSVSEAIVLANLNQGIQKVVNIMRGDKILVTCTKQHPFVMENNKVTTVKSLNDVTDFGRTFLKRKYVEIPAGTQQIDQAYSIGALLGDGCSREGGLVLSGADEGIISKVSTTSGFKYKKCSPKNFSWYLKGNSKFNIPFYREWLHNKYAHEKLADINVIKSWNRKSQLEFLAGLIDTDGCVQVRGNRLKISLSMQAESVVNAAKFILENLFQIGMCKYKDNRIKYKNGPVHVLSTNNNLDAKRVLKELSQYLQCERKKWKDEYNSLYSQNMSESYYGLKNISEEYEAQCYDLTIDNYTKLYLLGNGIVTHNTEACAADLLNTAITIPRSNSLYITLSRTSAERIIWRTLLNILHDYNIKHKVNNKELTLQFTNGSMIYVSGAKDKQEIEKFRGMSLNKVYVDEAQSFKPYVEELVEDILNWATKDVSGVICLTGTPGPIPQGYFYDLSTKVNERVGNHRWTLESNPWIKIKSGREPSEILAEERARKGITEQDPTYMREALGLWVRDENALVYQFKNPRNIYHKLPDKLNYIFGIDIGFNDADAIAVIGYNLQDPNVYLVEEYTGRKQNITSLVAEISRLQAKYKPVKMVMDAGALGKKIQEEIKFRHGIPVEAATKERKLEFIELLNDDLRTGRFLAPPNSLFEADSSIIVWDYDSGIKKVSDRTHTDIGDAILYAWRESRHYIPKDILLQKPLQGTAAYMDALEAKEAEAMLNTVLGNDEDWGVGDDDLAAVFDIHDNTGLDDW